MASVLLCEDSPTHMMLMQTLLEEDAHEVRCAEDGRRGMALIAEAMPDVVVTDLRMPEMNGLELVQAIVENYPKLPAVVVTARGSEDLAVDALALGAANFVPKNSLNVLLNPVVRRTVSFARSDQFYEPFAAQMRSPEFYYKLGNTLDAITPASQFVIEALVAANEMNPTQRVRVGMAVASALFNAISYGNLELKDEDPRIAGYIAGDPACRQALTEQAESPAFRKRFVHLKVSVGKADTRISVSHDGPGRIARFNPAPGTPESFELEQCRGMMLITSYMDDMVFNSDYSEVVMVKNHSVAPQSLSPA
ncbi:response regulator [Novipirellula artificiosorum]|uniref:Luminescence regulatory protein LuxO n=1 Tax=Novipirellula artificiosorum TaxID=2528016 RepID=A0A5C6DHA3_9BACT|nr:response regulator [Novipirellula artificiosorum]TWU35972.1 Luminescence regulatory protein LuxO [Novipirellula artificiosorum]